MRPGYALFASGFLDIHFLVDAQATGREPSAPCTQVEKQPRGVPGAGIDDVMVNGDQGRRQEGSVAGSSRRYPAVLFGEVLFDHFPDGHKVLGGAPFNVAWNLRALGDDPLLISGLGADAEGEEIRREMAAWGLSQEGMRTSSSAPTGSVVVSLQQGQPSYDIPIGQAWDVIEPGIHPSADSGALLYHGTLALRSRPSRDALLQLREGWQGPVFLDINLREPWYDLDWIRPLVDEVDWLKINVDEFHLLRGGDASQPDVSVESSLPELACRHRVRNILLTAGGEGAWLYSAPGELSFVAGRADICIADTVGAGDAFAAMSIHCFRRGITGKRLIERAAAFAGAVCGISGATSKDEGFYRPFSS
jgi:fructokinase